MRVSFHNLFHALMLQRKVLSSIFCLSLCTTGHSCWLIVKMSMIRTGWPKNGTVFLHALTSCVYFLIVLTTDYNWLSLWRSWTSRIEAPYKSRVDWLIDWSNINRFHYFTIRIRRKFVIILSLKIPPDLKCVATLPCEMSSVLKATIENTTTSVTTHF